MTNFHLTLEQPERESNTVRVSLKNKTGRAIRVLKWGTPFDSVANDCLSVTSAPGQECPYIGIRAKRGFSLEKSTLFLAPDSVAVAEVNIGKCWDIPAIGVYEVQLRCGEFEIAEVVNKYDSVGEESFRVEQVMSTGVRGLFRPDKGIDDDLPMASDFACDPPDYEVQDFEHEINSPLPVCPPLVFCLYPSYKNGGECLHNRFLGYPRVLGTSGDKNLVLDYVRMHKPYILDSGSWVPGRWDFHTDPVYRRWFGEYNPTRGREVARVLRRICSAKTCLKFAMLVTRTNDDVVAFWREASTPDRLSVMGFTQHYFRLRHSGFNCRAGTIAHELSHGYAGTTDLAYGQRRCLGLARWNPDGAIRNADSYQYYLEEKRGFSLEEKPELDTELAL